MRPRTAVTLWQSLVRPLLEYASELWGGQVTQAQVAEAETVQMTFLRGTLRLHADGSGVANEVVRAEGVNACRIDGLSSSWATGTALQRTSGPLASCSG